MSGEEKPPVPESRCGVTSESMVSWTCKCGGRWLNEQLRQPDRTQKTDEHLVIEKDEAYLNHVREMERLGYA